MKRVGLMGMCWLALIGRAEALTCTEVSGYSSFTCVVDSIARTITLTQTIPQSYPTSAYFDLEFTCSAAFTDECAGTWQVTTTVTNGSSDDWVNLDTELLVPDGCLDDGPFDLCTEDTDYGGSDDLDFTSFDQGNDRPREFDSSIYETVQLDEQNLKDFARFDTCWPIDASCSYPNTTSGCDCVGALSAGDGEIAANETDTQTFTITSGKVLHVRLAQTPNLNVEAAGCGQVMVFGSVPTDTLPTDSSPRYFGPQGNGADSQLTGSAALRYCIAPVAGTASSLRVKLSTAPGTGTSRRFGIVRSDGSILADCTIADSDTSCNSGTEGGTINAQDRFLYKTAAFDTPALASSYHATMVYTSDTEGVSIYCGNTTLGLSSSSTTFVPLIDQPATLVEEDTQLLIPTAGNVSHLCVNVGTAPGSGRSRTFTVRKNGVNQSLVLTLSDDETLECVSGSDAFVAGDLLSVSSTPSGTPAANNGVEASVAFTAATPGEFFLPQTDNNSANAFGTRYAPVSASNQFPQSTEASIDQLAQSMTISKIYAYLTNAAPGAGTSYTFNLRQNATSPGLAVVLSDSERLDSATGDITIANDDLLDTEVDPDNTPATTDIKVTYLATTTACAGVVEEGWGWCHRP